MKWFNENVASVSLRKKIADVSVKVTKLHQTTIEFYRDYNKKENIKKKWQNDPHYEDLVPDDIRNGPKNEPKNDENEMIQKKNNNKNIGESNIINNQKVSGSSCSDTEDESEEDDDDDDKFHSFMYKSTKNVEQKLELETEMDDDDDQTQSVNVINSETSQQNSKDNVWSLRAPLYEDEDAGFITLHVMKWYQTNIVRWYRVWNENGLLKSIYENPLKFWFATINIPALCYARKLAIQHLGCANANVSCERLLGKTNYYVSPERNRMSTDLIVYYN